MPTHSVRTLIATLFRRLGLGEEGSRIGTNFGWLITDRMVRLTLSLVVNVWLVRYLGVERLGLMSYAQSVVVLMAVFATLGLETILVRDLVRKPEQARELLGTSLALRIAGSIVTLALSLAAVSIMRHGDRDAALLTLIFATTVFSQSFDVMEFWFQSRSRLRPLVTARMVGSVVSAIAKVAVILLRAPLPVVAMVIAGEYAISSLGLVVAFRTQPDGPSQWRVQRAQAIDLLRSAWPLFLNSIAIVISVRVDQMIVTAMHGPHENGLYAAAQRLTEVIYYVPVAVMAAANPALLRSHQSNPDEYARRLQRVFSLLALGGVAIAVGVSLLSPWIIKLLFGAEFAGSAPVLAIQAWTAPMLFIGVAQTNWFIAHNRQTGLLLRSAVAAALSVTLNFALVPVLGARGAAITTLVSQTVGQVALNACFTETRPLFRMQMRAFLPVLPR